MSYDEVRRYRRELASNAAFQAEVGRRQLESRGGCSRAAELYALTRALRPEFVVETGVASGVSSAHFLQALADNGRGELHSIDLPGAGPVAALTPGRETGWLVPQSLRDRWHLLLGDSRAVLPTLLESLPRVDLFLHDGDHSFDTMKFELESVLPKFSGKGALLCDDADLNTAFSEFCRRHDLVAHRIVRMGLTHAGRPA